MRLHFRSDLVGARPLHLLSQTALPLKSPTGAFIAALRFANAVPDGQKIFKVRQDGFAKLFMNQILSLYYREETM